MWSKKGKILTLVILAEVLVLVGLVAFLLKDSGPDTDTTVNTGASTEESRQTTAPSTEQTTPGTTETVPVTTVIETEPIVLELSCTAGEDNVYTLTWNEVPGTCLVQISEDDGAVWQTVSEVSEGECSYTTGHLDAFKTYLLRVTTEDGASFDQCAVTTAQQPIYSTIWPLVSLDVYSDSEGQQVIGTAPAGAAYCVLDETGGFFCIRYGDGVGYIDSNYCMINLPEYVGELCAYDITNSYDAIYKVHELAIDDVTGTVITGYEDVLLADGSYLVPLLYPAARKLVDAAQTAQEQGYRLKIYDSFRPHKATKEIYALTEKIVDKPLPEDAEQTYRSLMTDNGRYRLSNFLANGVSRHNVGVAVDLTLETLEGEEVRMQSTIHDLSWYSALECNGDNSDLLQSIMVQAGFNTLDSEWWHFQDGEAYKALELKYLYEGVSAACWMKDDGGWRYRNADGTYLMDCTQTIDGISCTFDSNGYFIAQ